MMKGHTDLSYPQVQVVLHSTGTGSWGESWNEEQVLKTPSDYFQLKYPSLTQRFGPAFLEVHWLDDVGLLNVDCDEINIDLFAAIIGGTDDRSKVVYYEPEHRFYRMDTLAGHFKIVSEETLKFGLSQELLHCASYFSEHRQRVSITNIFKRFRREEVLDAILKRAEGLLAKDESFFAEGKGHRRAPQFLTGIQTARIFVQEAIKPHPGRILKLGDAYDCYVSFCETKSLPLIRKNEFKRPTVLAIRDTFNLGFRNDLKLDGKYAHGWKGLEVVAGAPQTALAE